MRGVVSALEDLGYASCFDAIYCCSSGAINGAFSAYLVAAASSAGRTVDQVDLGHRTKESPAVYLTHCRTGDTIAPLVAGKFRLTDAIARVHRCRGVSERPADDHVPRRESE